MGIPFTIQAEEDHDPITNVFIDISPVLIDCLPDHIKVSVERMDNVVREIGFRKWSEAFDVDKHDSQWQLSTRIVAANVCGFMNIHFVMD